MKKHFLSLLSLVALFLLFSCSDSAENAVPLGTGTGGSMARFAVTGNYLYVVDSRMLQVFDVTNPSAPAKIKEIEIGFAIETIFPYEDKLFIGSQNGMYIYDISVPDSPAHLSTYFHITSCDPVVVQGNLAYVTLRTDASCPRGSNQLDIIDISDPLTPTLLRSYQMDSPFGLGIDGSTLFVGEGRNGLTVLNVEDPFNIRIVSTLENVHTFDVIPGNNNLILTGKNGVYQFDYTQPDNLQLRSQLFANACD